MVSEIQVVIFKYRIIIEYMRGKMEHLYLFERNTKSNITSDWAIANWALLEIDGKMALLANQNPSSPHLSKNLPWYIVVTQKQTSFSPYLRFNFLRSSDPRLIVFFMPFGNDDVIVVGE